MDLKTEDIWFGYRNVPVIKGLNLRFKRGEIVGIAGPNGAGKTTLLRLLSGVLTPLKGRILLNERNIFSMKRKELSKYITLVPQIFQPVYPYTVEEVVRMGTYPLDNRTVEIEKVMRFTGVLSIKKRTITSLSGGELRLVLIAKAVAQDVEFLLLDEPFAHLDFHHIKKVAEIVRALRKNGKGIIIVSHDLNFLFKMCDRYIFIRDGKIVGERREVDENILKETYGEGYIVINLDERLLVFPEI